MLQPPFYLPSLNTLHDRILTSALAIESHPLGFLVSACLATAPMLPIAFLVLEPPTPSTHGARVALGMLGIGAASAVAASFRFAAPSHNGLNIFLIGAWLVILFRYAEWVCLGRIVDPWRARGRSRALAALDLTFNVRGVFLGNVGVDTSAGVDNGNSVTTSRMPPPGRHLPQPAPPQSRLRAALGHSWAACWRYLLLDLLSTHLRTWAADTLARGTPNGITLFSQRVGVRVLPHLLDLHLPPRILEAAAVLLLPTAVYLWLALISHAVAAVAVASGVWEVDAWSVGLFDRPYASDSLLDLWGSRWHQVMRHPLVTMATLTARALYLPSTSSTTVVPLTFLYSAIFHTLAHLAMDPVPSSRATMTFFLLSGAGCCAEVLFRRLTGRRVHGVLGHWWVWFATMALERPLLDAWTAAGFPGLFALLPPGLAELVSPWLWTWVYGPYWK